MNYMHYKTSLLLFLIISLLYPIQSFSGGDGTPGNPYNISNCVELQNMSSNLNAHYQLEESIDCSGINFIPVGNCTANCNGANRNPFFGTFNGNNFTIDNLNITNTTSPNSAWGLFGSAESGTIENLILKDAYINVPSNNYIGALIGYSDVVNVNNVNVSATVIGDRRVGGLIGEAYIVLVENSYNNVVNISGTEFVGGLIGYSRFVDTINTSIYGNVEGSTFGGTGGGFGYGAYLIVDNAYFSGTVTGRDEVGGLLGKSGATTNEIDNSASSGSVSGRNNVGGLVGESNQLRVSNSWSNSSVTGDINVGGLVGYNINYGDIRNSYSTGNVTVLVSEGGGLVGLNDLDGEISNSYYLNTTGNPDIAIGFDVEAQSVTAITDENFFFNYSNALYNGNWNNNTIWTFSGSSYPTLNYLIEEIEENPITSPVSESTSSLFPMMSIPITIGILMAYLII